MIFADSHPSFSPSSPRSRASPTPLRRSARTGRRGVMSAGALEDGCAGGRSPAAARRDWSPRGWRFGGRPRQDAMAGLAGDQESAASGCVMV